MGQETVPKIGRKYKHHSGSIYIVVDICGNSVRIIRNSTNYILTIGLDMWNCPVTTDDDSTIQRFTIYSRKEVTSKHDK
ncbi:hypothetical protein [Sedimentibacter sp.]|uniref:hypothetical protein n=1 Tax=Sedimentibacter sp. TaxID=1960295 RepID=UPI0028A7BB67|nr:hypothetical protein [Sedimentibacter sp.]